MTMLTQDRLKSLLMYNPDTGVFVRRVKIKNQPAGTIVGTVQTGGYLGCSIDGKLYKMHRLAWLYHYGCWPANQLDHINHNPADNRIVNLRDVSCAQNHQNRARKTKSKSGYLGVTWHNRDKRWQAHIEINGKAIHLGQFKCLNEAISARLTAEKQYHLDRPEHASAHI